MRTTSVITGLQLGTMWQLQVVRGRLSAFWQLRVRWLQLCKVGQYLDNWFFSPGPFSFQMLKERAETALSARPRRKRWVTLSHFPPQPSGRNIISGIKTKTERTSRTPSGPSCSLSSGTGMSKWCASVKEVSADQMQSYWGDVFNFQDILPRNFIFVENQLRVIPPKDAFMFWGLVCVCCMCVLCLCVCVKEGAVIWEINIQIKILWELSKPWKLTRN